MSDIDDSTHSTTIDTIHQYSIDIDHREIYLYQEIDDSVAAAFIKNLNYLNHLNHDPITIYSLSIGGEMTYSLGIYDAIKLSVSPTIGISCGEVASMGTIIAQAPNIRLLFPSTTFLIHEGSINLGDTEAKTAISTMNSFKEFIRRLYNIYYSSCKNGVFFHGKTESYIRKFFKQNLQRKSDWYLLAEEVVKYGLADGILGDGKYNNLSAIRNILSNTI
mgnify:CR=1 FL=1